jgi:hypothetical protein
MVEVCLPYTLPCRASGGSCSIMSARDLPTGDALITALDSAWHRQEDIHAASI